MMQLALALPLWRVQVRRSAERGHWAWFATGPATQHTPCGLSCSSSADSEEGAWAAARAFVAGMGGVL